MKKNDNGIGELLELLEAHPELIRELVFDPVAIKRLLKSKAARQLVRGVDTKAFLEYVSSPVDGVAFAACGGGTGHLYAKGTGYDLCVGGTKPGCGGGTGFPCLPGTRCGGGTGPPCGGATTPPCRRGTRTPGCGGATTPI